MQALIDSNGAIYLSDWSSFEESRYRARFYFDPNGITMAHGNIHYLTERNLVETWELIDLYLRLDGGDASTSERFAMRDYFGFKTDDYYEGFRREIYMTRKTEEYIQRFLEVFAADECPNWGPGSGMGWEEVVRNEVRPLLTK